MKLSALAVTLALLVGAHSDPVCYETAPGECDSGLAKISVTEDVLSKEECEYLLSQVDAYPYERAGRMYQNIPVRADIHDKVRQPLFEGDERVLMISKLVETSARHIDKYGDEADREYYGRQVEEDVSMVFLADNKNATFVYLNERIPVRAGTELVFNGGYMHHTEVLAGTVNFLGPFATNSGRFVGPNGKPTPAPKSSKSAKGPSPSGPETSKSSKASKSGPA